MIIFPNLIFLFSISLIQFSPILILSGSNFGQFNLSKKNKDRFKLYQEVKSYKELIKVADSTKNIYLKQLAYKTVELVATRTGETLFLPQKNLDTNALKIGDDNKDILSVMQ